MGVIGPSRAEADLAEAAALAEDLLAGGAGPGELAGALYADWYLRPRRPPRAAGPVSPFEADPVAALRAAHAGGERFASGWRARRVSTRGRVEAVRDGQVRALDRIDYVVPARPGLRAEPGDLLLMADRADEVQDGFWVTYLGAWEGAAGERLTRLYWRIAPEAATRLVAGLTGTLLDADVPAAVKVCLAPDGPGRADAAVAYLPSAAWNRVAPALRAVAGSVADGLHDPPPALTLRLAPGLGAAEGRAGEESFGQDRCRLVAEGLHGGGPAGVRRRFAEAGLDPDRPHLEAGSGTVHAW